MKPVRWFGDETSCVGMRTVTLLNVKTKCVCMMNDVCSVHGSWCTYRVFLLFPVAHTGCLCCFLVHIQGDCVVSWCTYRVFLLFPGAHTGCVCFLVHIQGDCVVSWCTYRVFMLFPGAYTGCFCCFLVHIQDVSVVSLRR